MNVADVMTRDVVTAELTTPYKRLVELMLDRGCTGLPVLDDRGHVVGVVTEADLVDRPAYGDRPRRLLDVVHDAFTGPPFEAVRKATSSTASGLMTEDPVTASPSDSVGAAARRMLEHKVKRLPVVDDDGRLIGIVSRRDLLRAYARPDGEIERDALDALHDVARVPETLVLDAVRVRDGYVEVRGSVEFPTDIAVIEAALRRLPGVLGVLSHLDPRSPQPAGPYDPLPV